MSPKEYAHAIIELLRSGARPESVLSGLDATLARRGHTKLRRRILTIVERTLTARANDTGVTLTLANESDETHHREAIEAVTKALDAAQTTATVIDPTLIGGFVVTTGTKRADRSYKRTLANLYRSITNSSRT